MSEESFVTTVQEQEFKDTNIAVSDKAAQVDLPFHGGGGNVTPRHRHHRSRLQRHHTSDLILDNTPGNYYFGYTRTLSKNPYPARLRYDSHYFRPRSLALDFPFFTSRSGQFSSDSGYSGTRRTKSYYQSTGSPTFSVTPPNSLDYLYESKGDRSSAGSITPNRMNNTNGMTNSGKAINCDGVYLSPGYLQNPFMLNHAASETRLALGSRSSGSSCQCPCRCGAQGDTGETSPSVRRPLSADGLSWRRLHMSRAKLKATATTSELLSGFAMIAMVELQINEPTNVPEWLFVMFAVCTTVLVAIHIFALMISTYLLPNIDAVSKMGDGGAEDVIRDSPHERMRGFIELAWAFSTVLGLFLFLVEIAILCWVKFWDYSFAAATAATVIVIPVLIVFVAFAIHFYHSLVVHKCESSHDDMKKLENMKRNLDSATMKAGSPV